MSKTGRFVLVLIIILAIGGLWYSQGKQPTTERGPIKLGVVLPLTGDAAYWGEHAEKAIRFAVQDVNESGGIDGRDLAVVMEDGQCDPKTGVSAVQKLIEVDQVAAVIGEVCSSVTLAMAAVSQARGIVQVAPCSEAPTISEAGDYIFRTWTPNNRQAVTVARYAREKLKLGTVATLAINNDFGLSLASKFKEQFEALGGQVVSSDVYAQSARDFRTLLAKIKGSKTDAIYLASHIPDGVAAVKQIRELGIKSQVIVTSGADSDEFFKPLGELAEGIVFPSLNESTTPAFQQRYTDITGEKWPGINSCASVAYDDVAMLTAAMRAKGTAAKDIRDYLSTLKNYPGVSGPITFDANGDLDREHAMFIYQDGKRQLVE